MPTPAIQNFAAPSRLRGNSQPARSEAHDGFEHLLEDARRREPAPESTKPQPKAPSPRKSKSSRADSTKPDRDPAAASPESTEAPAENPTQPDDDSATPIENTDAAALEHEPENKPSELVAKAEGIPADPLALITAAPIPPQTVAQTDVTPPVSEALATESVAAAAKSQGQAVPGQPSAAFADGAPADLLETGANPARLPDEPVATEPSGEPTESPAQPPKPVVRALGNQDSQSRSSPDRQGGDDPSQLPKTLAAAPETSDSIESAPIDVANAIADPAASEHPLNRTTFEPAVQLTGQPSNPAHATVTTKPAQPATHTPEPPELHFAQNNHDRIVTGVRTQLLPHGGSMQLRLDPPELGALQVMVEMRDGVMTATFQTSNEQATQLLSHSLNHLKTVLESQGVGVDRLQVQQAPKSENASTGQDQKQQQDQSWTEDHASRQEQQRKELLKRMWRKISGNADPLDLVA